MIKEYGTVTITENSVFFTEFELEGVSDTLQAEREIKQWGKERLNKTPTILHKITATEKLVSLFPGGWQEIQKEIDEYKQQNPDATSEDIARVLWIFGWRKEDNATKE